MPGIKCALNKCYVSNSVAQLMSGVDSKFPKFNCHESHDTSV